MTNYEWIKKLSIEELSDFLYKIKQGEGICEDFPYDDCSGDCKQCLLGWLKEESEENELSPESKSDLKPCPFCGGEARLLLNATRKIYGRDEYRTGVVACCNVCEARMFYGSKKLAIESWNRRASDAN